MTLRDTVHFLNNHPLTRDSRRSAWSRFAKFQISSRIFARSSVVPFVNETRIVVSPGMAGATGNFYCGLNEFEDMAFLLHFLRRTDTFFDIGANVGSYTILASAVTGAKTVSVEPVPRTFSHLLDNISLNAIGPLVRPLNMGIGDEIGELVFTSDLDCVNHVVRMNSTEPQTTVSVKATTLDALSQTSAPNLIKIDVEGFEGLVLKGGPLTMNNPDLHAVILELNGSGKQFGYEDEQLHGIMNGFGFVPCTYDPRRRQLTTVRTYSESGNTLYVREPSAVRSRLETAQPFRVLEQAI